MNANHLTDCDSDLRWAIDFVLGRIRRSAQAVSEVLTEEDEETLKNLPSDSVDSTLSAELGTAGPIPPDRSYDKLVRMAKEALKHDRGDIVASKQWELADAILRFHEHRLSWLIERAGVTIQKPWWDGWLLVICGTAVILIPMATGALVYELGFRSERQVFGSICVVFALICVMLFYVLDYFEQRLRLNRIRELQHQVR